MNGLFSYCAAVALSDRALILVIYVILTGVSSATSSDIISGDLRPTTIDKLGFSLLLRLINIGLSISFWNLLFHAFASCSTDRSWLGWHVWLLLMLFNLPSFFLGNSMLILTLLHDLDASVLWQQDHLSVVSLTCKIHGILLMKWSLSCHVVLLLSLKSSALVLSHLINALQLLLLNFAFLLLHQGIVTHVIVRGHHLMCEASVLLLLRYLRFYQIHLRSKLCSLLQRSILISSAYVFVCVDVLELLLIHECLLHLLSLIFAWHRTRTLLRCMLLDTVFAVSNLVCVASWGHYISTLRSKCRIELVGILDVRSSQTWKLIRMNLRHHCHLHLVGVNVIWLSSLMNLILLFGCLLDFNVVSIQELLTIFQIHYHLLLLIVFVALVWTWLRIKLTLRIKIGLCRYLTKVWNLTRMVASQAGSLMLHWNLLLLLRMLAVSAIVASTMDVATDALLVGIRLILRLLLNIICVLLISVLRLHNIIIIYMFILIQGLFLPSIMRIVNFISNLRIVSTVVHLIWALNHIHVLMIARNMMRLKMILLFQNIDVFVSGHDVSVRHWIVEIFFVVADVLCSRLQDILYLCF